MSRTTASMKSLAAALLLMAPFMTRPAAAQAVMDPAALDALTPTPKPETPRMVPLHHPSAPATKSPALPSAAPPAITIPPPVAVPLRPTPPPPPIPLNAKAAGTAGSIPGGVRITFGAGSSQLNPTTLAAIRAIAAKITADADANVNVSAYAAGTPEDPSTPRRLSLSRALAVRAVLIHEGIPSPRIFVRAMGMPEPGTLADRVDVTLAGKR